MTVYVFDACALLAIALAESGCSPARDALASSKPRFIHAMNMAEVYYRIHDKTRSAATAEDTVTRFKRTGVQILETMDEAFWKDAAWCKVVYKLGFLDAIAFATARREKARLVSKDRNAFEGIKKAFSADLILF